MESPMRDREPCPDRILDDMGTGFGIGAVGGSIFYFLKGLKNSPMGERFVGGSQAVRMNVPRTAGSFAVWSGLYSTFDCAMVYLRQKEDPWNSILAGAATSGFFRLRGGLRAACTSAAGGAALVALIEGAGIVFNKMESARREQQVIIVEDFTGVKKEAEKKKRSGDGVKTEILESFDTPVPPTFDFK